MIGAGDPVLFIDGRWTVGEGDDLCSTNPHDDTVVWSGPSARPEQATEAVAAAAAAQARWRRTALPERVAIVERFGKLLAESRGELAELITRETGKPLWDADGELAALLGKVGVSVDAFEQRTGTMRQELGGATVETTHRPLGPLVVLGPFNFPALLPGGHIVPALIAGNTIVFKPSELVPAVAAATVRLWERAGAPPGVVNLVQGGAEVATALLDHESTRGVLFTGGVAAGAAVRRRLVDRPEVLAALELGGNNPLVVWDVESVEAAARLVVKSAYISSGQRCLCARRLVVPEGAPGDALVSAVAELSGRLRIGDPRGEPQPFLGPLIHAAAAQRVLASQRALVERGAEVVVAAAPVEGFGPAYVSPGLLEVGDIDRDDEEVFGPLLQVTRVPDFEAAVVEANATRFGLSAGLISDDVRLFEHFRLESDAGLVNFNAPTVAASGLNPFGGTGHSGNHRPAGFYAADYCSYPVATYREDVVADEGGLLGIDDRAAP